MTESKLFVRESTGLVRQGSWIDSFVFNSSASWLFGPLVFALSQLFWLGGSDLILAEVVALAFALCIATMYAILTSAMPRSGGDYVFNSRIIHPSVGFSFNFSLTVWQLFSAAFTLYFISYSALSPGLQVLGFFLGNKSLYSLGTALGTPLDSFIVGTLANVVFAAVIASGIKKTFRLLDALWIVTIIGTLAMIASLSSSSPSAFHASFNSFARVANGSGTVSDPFSYVASQASSPIPYTLALPAIAICSSSVIWVFWETYVSGEIKRADQARRNFTTMASAALTNGALFIILVYLLYRAFGTSFLVGLLNLSFTGTLFSSPLQAISGIIILSSGSALVALLVIVAVVLGTTVLLLPALYLQPIRSIFAWSFDGVAPLSFSKVSGRLHTPIVSTLIISAVIEVSLVLITLENSLLLPIFYAVIIAPAFSSIFPTALSAIAASIRRRGTVVELFRQQGISRPLIAILGVASLGFILFMTYVFVANEAAFSLSPALVALNFAFIPIGFVLFFVAYLIRRAKNKIDLAKIAAEIPPE